jgi:hypothetical protein
LADAFALALTFGAFRGAGEGLILDGITAAPRDWCDSLVGE